MTPGGSILAPIWVQNSLPEASGTLLGARWAPGAFPGGSRDASAVPKNSLLSSGGPLENFPSEISPSQGLILALRLATGVQNAIISIFANGPHENLDFQGSGGLPGGIFGTKNRSKNKLEAKTARTHTPGASNSLPER